MKHEIVVNDSWFRNAYEMVQFLKQHFIDDASKYYYYIDEKENAGEKIEERRKAHHWLQWYACA